MSLSGHASTPGRRQDSPLHIGMKAVILLLTTLCSPVIAPLNGSAALTAQEIITLAQQQLTVPAEFVLGEMTVYRGEKQNRFYSFVLGRRWEAETQTEYVRIDFKTAINSAPDSSSLYSDHRYLLKRTLQALPTQWLYLPALRRVRITPYRPDDPLLQSHYLFYDLTTILDFTDYRYQFVAADEQNPIIAGEPRTAFVPYQRTFFTLERRGGTYIVTEVRYIAHGKERQARFSTFNEIISGYYRPQQLVVTVEEGRTEVRFQHWTASNTAEARVFTPIHLETQALTLPAR